MIGPRWTCRPAKSLTILPQLLVASTRACQSAATCARSRVSRAPRPQTCSSGKQVLLGSRQRPPRCLKSRQCHVRRVWHDLFLALDSRSSCRQRDVQLESSIVPGASFACCKQRRTAITAERPSWGAGPRDGAVRDGGRHQAAHRGPATAGVRHHQAGRLGGGGGGGHRGRQHHEAGCRCRGLGPA